MGLIINRCQLTSSEHVPVIYFVPSKSFSKKKCADLFPHWSHVLKVTFALSQGQKARRRNYIWFVYFIFEFIRVKYMQKERKYSSHYDTDRLSYVQYFIVVCFIEIPRQFKRGFSNLKTNRQNIWNQIFDKKSNLLKKKEQTTRYQN